MNNTPIFDSKLEEQFKRIFNDAKKVTKDKPVVITAQDSEKEALPYCEYTVKTE